MLACLLTIAPLDKSTGDRFTMRLSSIADRRVCGLNNVAWEPAITEAPALGMQFWNGGFESSTDAGKISFTIGLAQAKKSYPAAVDAVWIGAEVEVFLGRVGAAWPWTSRFKGRVTSVGDGWPSVQITAVVDIEPFNVDVLNLTYAGTGEAEGGSDLTNRVKPLALGHPRNVEPVLIDAVNNVHQFSAYGPIEAVETLYERASAFTAAIADYADFDALVAADINPGEWATCLAEGLIRLGAPAYGIITGDIKGHAVTGTAPRGAGALVEVLADIVGLDSGLIASTALAALDGEGATNSDLMLTEQVKFLEAARRLVLPCNWQVVITNAGVLTVLKPEITGAADFTLHAQGKRVPLVVDTTEQQVSLPFKKTTMAAERCWRVHTLDEIATGYNLIDRGNYDAAEVYRSGNIVTMPDGSRWLFVSDEPQAGVTPGTDGTVWELVQEASASNYTARLTNAAHVVNADSSGTVASFSGAGGTFVVEDASGSAVSGITFSIVSQTGVTMTINASTGLYAVTAMSATQGTATLRATLGSLTFDLVYSIAKAIAGTNGASSMVARISPPTVHVPMNSAGTVTSYAAATFNFVVTKFDGTDISSKFTLSTASGGNPAGLTVAYSGQTGTISGGFDANESTAPLTVKATGFDTYAGIEFTQTFTLTKDAAILSLSIVAGDAAYNSLVPNTPTGMSSISIGRTFATGNVSLFSTFGFTYSSDPANRNCVTHFELGWWVDDTSAGHTMGTDIKEVWNMVATDMTAATSFAPYFATEVAGNKYYHLGVRACRKVHPSVNPSGWIKSAIRQVGPFRPSAYQVIDKDNVYLGDMLFSVVRQAALNFNADNDANALVPPAATSVAVSGTTFTDSTGKVTVTWAYTHSTTPTAANNIDGFIIGLMTRASNAGYTYNAADDALIRWETASATDRGWNFTGVPVDHWNTAIVIPYRSVRTDVDGLGVIEAPVAQSSSTVPLRLASSPQFMGLIDTATAANVADGTARARVGLTSGGDVATGKVLTGSVATDALNKGSWVAQGTGISFAVNDSAGLDMLTMSTTTSYVICQFILDYQISIVDPVLGEEPYFTITLKATNNSTGTVYSSGAFTVSDVWNQASASGTKKFARDSVGIEHVFTTLPAGSYTFSYWITTNTRCAMYAGAYRYMRVEDKKAIS